MEQSSTKRVPVQTLAGGKEGTGVVEACYWSMREKTKRGLISLVLSWSLALLSVSLFMAQYILVPFFIVLGPLLFFWARRQEGQFLLLEADCPYCKSPLVLETRKVNLSWPLRLVCKSCNEPVRIDPDVTPEEQELAG